MSNNGSDSSPSAVRDGPPENGVTIGEMVELCMSEAARIETMQEALVETGLRTAADPGQLRRVRIYDAIIVLLELIRADSRIMERLRQHRLSPRPAPAASATAAVTAPQPGAPG